MATRQYKLMGDPFTADTTATVVFDGVEIFNGTFNGGPDEPEVVMATGNLDITNPADGSNITKSVSITVSSGSVLVGMFEWNYASILNPAINAGQQAILEDKNSTKAERIAIFEAVANPPFSSADLAVLASTDPADKPIQYELLYTHNCLLYVQDPSMLNYGLTPELCLCNRTNVLLNGVTPPDANTNIPVQMTAGDVLTFDTIIFASNFLSIMPANWHV